MNDDTEQTLVSGLASRLGVPLPKSEEITPLNMETLKERLSKRAEDGPPLRRPIPIDPCARLPRRSRLLSVENEPVVAHAKLNDEWLCDDWIKVAAYALVRATSWQYSEMMQGLHALINKRMETHPEEDPQMRDYHVLQEWARKYLADGCKKNN